MRAKNKIIIGLLVLCQGGFHAYSQADNMLYLELILNGKTSGKVLPILQTADDWQMQSEDLLALGLKLNLADKRTLLLSEIKGLEVVYDEPLQQLWLTVPVELLPMQYLTANSIKPISASARRDRGLLVNYDLFSVAEDRALSQSSLWYELNLFEDKFYIVDVGLFQENHDLVSSPAYTRFESYLQYDNEEGLWGLTLGDVINAAPNWGRSLRMGGIRIARDYELDPTLITYPLPEFYGESTLPSSVELIINNQFRWRDQIGSGPFLINSLPYISGAGSAQILTTNALGQQTQKNINFYVTSQLLSPGIVDYDFTLGLRREDFGFRSNAYADDPIVSGSMRYGYNRYLTPQLLVQGGEGLSLGGVGLTFLAGSLGVFEVADVYSDYKGVGGRQASIAYSFNQQNIGLNARYLERYDDYRDLSYLDFDISNAKEAQFSFSVHQDFLGTFNLGYFYNEGRDGVGKGLVNVSWNRYFSSDFAAFVNFNRQLYGNNEKGISIALSIPLGRRGDISTATQRDSEGKWNNQIQSMRNAPYHGGMGWKLGLDDTPENNFYGILDWNSQYTGISAGVYRNDGDTQYTGELKGALVLMKGDVFASRFISDAFALVDSRQANIPVLIGNQFIGNTNHSGKLLIPDLYSYLENHISIDPITLPANASLESVEQMVVPRRKGGVYVEFPVELTQSAVVIAYTTDLQPLPPGSVLETPDGSQKFITGWNGEIYIGSLSQAMTLYWVDGGCILNIVPIPDKTMVIPRMGPFFCLKPGDLGVH